MMTWLHAHGVQHRAGDFAREGAFLRPADVLRADADAATP